MVIASPFRRSYESKSGRHASTFLMDNRISVAELRKLLESDLAVHLVDVRSADEFASGHVPRATNIPLEEIEGRIDDLGSRVVVLCKSGNRASMACELLRAHHPNMILLEGGTQAWAQAGLPLATSSVRVRWSLERQVRLAAGLIVLTGTLLSLFVNANWIYLAVFAGVGLTFAGATDLCLMASLLGKLPWNRPKSSLNG